MSNVNDTVNNITSSLESNGIAVLDSYGYEEDGIVTIGIEVGPRDEERAIEIAGKFGNADVFTHNTEYSRIYVHV